MTSPFPQITSPPQASAEVVVNEALETLKHQAVYGKKQSTTTGLTWGYYGGRWGGFSIADGTLALTNAATNYIVVAVASGVASVSTSSTNWNDATNYVRVYKLTTAGSVVTAEEDHRAGPGGVHGGGGASSTFTGGTLSSALNEAPTVTVASSTTPAIFAAAGNTINMTGTTTVAGFDTIAAGAMRRVIFAGALQLTHNATSMQNITGANITTVAGDVAEFISLGSGNTKMLSYTRKDGTTLSGTSFSGGTLSSALNEAPIVTIASSSTPAIGAAAANSILLTGTVTVTGFDTIAAGAFRRVRFGGILTLTYNATSLILPTSANITTAADDVAEFLSLGSGNWFCTSYSRKSGLPTGAVGYINIPQNSQSAAYTTVLSDQGKHLLHPSADTTARTFTIDSNANVAYPVGTALTFVNQHSAGVMTIAITSDTMRLAGAGTTGSRALAADGVATAIKIASTEWIISGTGLT